MTPTHDIASINLVIKKFRHPGRNKLFPKKPLDSYSFASEAGNFGDELSVPGLSRRYEPDVPSINFQ